MALVVTLDASREEVLKIGDNIEIMIRPKRGNKLIEAVIFAPKEIEITRQKFLSCDVTPEGTKKGG